MGPAATLAFSARNGCPAGTFVGRQREGTGYSKILAWTETSEEKELTRFMKKFLILMSNGLY